MFDETFVLLLLSLFSILFFVLFWFFFFVFFSVSILWNSFQCKNYFFCPFFWFHSSPLNPMILKHNGTTRFALKMWLTRIGRRKSLRSSSFPDHFSFLFYSFFLIGCLSWKCSDVFSNTVLIETLPRSITFDAKE